MKINTKASINNAMSYEAYRKLVSELIDDNKSTGKVQSEDLYKYSFLNDRRMKRLDKTSKLIEPMQETIDNVKKPQTWVVLTEGWCGDAAHILPFLNKIAEASENITLKVVLRDENLDLIDKFLTNGGRAIPKLLALDAEHNILFDWGPRPSFAAKMIADYKKEHGVVDAKVKEELQVWYNKNKGVNIQEDIASLLKA